MSTGSALRTPADMLIPKNRNINNITHRAIIYTAKQQRAVHILHLQHKKYIY
jgi:hypothetical protein